MVAVATVVEVMEILTEVIINKAGGNTHRLREDERGNAETVKEEFIMIVIFGVRLYQS